MHILESPTNRGFGGGNNLGIEAALRQRGRRGALAQQRCLVDARSVAAMLATLWSDPAIGVVGPTIWHRDECVSAGGRDIARYGVTHLRPRRAAHDCGGRRLRARHGGTPQATGVRERRSSGRGLLLRRRDGRSVPPGSAAWVPVGHRPRGRARHDLDRSLRARETLHVYYVVRNRFLYVRKHHARRRVWLYARWMARAVPTLLAALCRGRWDAGPVRDAGRPGRRPGPLREAE